MYKLHGSWRNVKTGEDTRESIITTLEALGKHRGDDVFTLEMFKRPLFQKICQGRTLIVMGYSGSHGNHQNSPFF
ncbi:MAG: hypothetical protein ACFFC7_33285 [Candidatus Hermodarchaeota archaeon]